MSKLASLSDEEGDLAEGFAALVGVFCDSVLDLGWGPSLLRIYVCMYSMYVCMYVVRRCGCLFCYSWMDQSLLLLSYGLTHTDYDVRSHKRGVSAPDNCGSWPIRIPPFGEYSQSPRSNHPNPDKLLVTLWSIFSRGESGFFVIRTIYWVHDS